MKNKKKLNCDMNPWQCLRLLIAITIIVFPLGIPTELLGQDVNHLYQQAGEAIQKGRLQDAAAIFERAAQLRPGDAEPLIGIAFTYIHLNRLQEAITILNRALAINPNSSEAHTNMGFAHWRMGNRDRAVQEYSIAIRMDPSNSQAHYNLGNSYLAMGSPATAIPFLEKAVQLQPNHMDALVTLGAARINMGDPAGAMKPLRRAVSLDPNRADTRYNLGLALGRSGYMSEAAKEFSWLETNNKEFALRLRQQLGDAVVRARLPIGDVPIPEPVQEEDDSSINLLGQQAPPSNSRLREPIPEIPPIPENMVQGTWRAEGKGYWLNIRGNLGVWDGPEFRNVDDYGECWSNKNVKFVNIRLQNQWGGHVRTNRYAATLLWAPPPGYTGNCARGNDHREVLIVLQQEKDTNRYYIRIVDSMSGKMYKQ
jgi:tetratricopeptide (TPR) repeat protein